MFTINIKADVIISDPEVLKVLHRLEKKIDKIVEQVVPGPAATLVLIPGPITEQK